MTSKERYQQRVKDGLCVQCGNQSEIGKTKCRLCFEKAEECRRQRTAKRKAEGKCATCAKPTEGDYTLCRECIEKHGATSLDRYYKKKAKGTCRACDKPAEKGSRTCADCNQRLREAKNARYVIRKEMGLCNGCSNTAIPGTAICEACNEKVSNRNKEKWDSDRRIVIEHYGHKCACPGCHVNSFELLQIDHIHGNGKEHRKEIGVSGIYKYLIEHNFPTDNYQILCTGCNTAKGRKRACPCAGRPH